MATIHSLPTEIVHRILELGSPWPTNIWIRPKESYAFLRIAALVSRTWTVSAQERLWQRVYLGVTGRAEAFLDATPGGGRRTVDLVLSAGVATESQLRTSVINACTGLRSLASLFIDRSALCSPAMAGVTSLAITYSRGLTPFTTTLPFHLTHLDLFQIPDPPVLDIFLQPTITSLSLRTPSIKPSHLLSLTRIAHRLISLRWPQHDHLLLQPFFRGCITLSHLSIDTEDLPAILPLIPSALEILTCVKWVPNAAHELLELLRPTPSVSVVVALSSLRCLQFEANEGFVTGCVHGRELLEECRAKGIEVQMGVVVQFSV